MALNKKVMKHQPEVLSFAYCVWQVLAVDLVQATAVEGGGADDGVVAAADEGVTADL